MSRWKLKGRRRKTKMGDENCSVLRQKNEQLQQTTYSSTILGWRNPMDRQSIVWVMWAALTQQSINREINLLTNQDSRTRIWNWPRAKCFWETAQRRKFYWTVLYVPQSGQYMYCTVVTICTASLTFNSSTSCPHTVFMCFVWIWKQTAIISLYNINCLVFITEI